MNSKRQKRIVFHKKTKQNKKHGILTNICSLPLGSQVISVPVNSSLSWHTNRLRDVSKDAYNVSYAWKLVGVAKDCISYLTVTHVALGLDESRTFL